MAIKDNNGVPSVNANIREICKQRQAATFALCKEYELRAKEIFLAEQGTEQLKKGAYWTNQRSVAAKLVTGFADKSEDWVQWGLKHQIEYGPALELANNRKHEALRPIVTRLAPEFMARVKEMWQS